MRSESELWNELVQAQQRYGQSLASLDALLFGETAAAPFPMGHRSSVEDAAKIRQAAYAQYRQAMDALTAYLRK